MQRLIKGKKREKHFEKNHRTHTNCENVKHQLKKNANPLLPQNYIFKQFPLVGSEMFNLCGF